jgi:hypothetical protein
MFKQSFLIFQKGGKLNNYIGAKALRLILSKYIFKHYPNFSNYYSLILIESIEADAEGSMIEKIGESYFKNGFESAYKVVIKEIISQQKDLTNLINYKNPQNVLKKFFQTGNNINI